MRSCNYTLFLISNTFIRQAQIGKNQANAKQHPEAELLVFGNYSHSSPNHPNIIGHTLKNKQKNKCVCIHEIVRLIIMKMKVKMKSRSHRYDMNKPILDMDTNIVNVKCINVMTMTMLL